MVQLLVLAGSIALGLRRITILGSIFLGVVATVLGQFIIAGGGPGAFVSLFVLPVDCAIVHFIRQRVARLIARSRKSQASDSESGGS